MTTLPDLDLAALEAAITDEQIGEWCAEAQSKCFGVIPQARYVIARALTASSVPEAGKAVVKVQHRVRPHKKAEWGPWTDGYVPKDYLGWFEQREVPTEIGWRDKRIEILTDECVRRSKQISEIAKQRNDAEIRAETAEAEAADLRRKLEEAREALRVIACGSGYEWSETREQLHRIIDAAVECANNALRTLSAGRAALEDKP